MSIQYSDTHFSENMPIDEAMKRFTECLATGIPVQALHVGTVPEINARKRELLRRADLQSQIDELRDKIESVEIAPTSNILHLPSAEDLKRFA